MFCVPDAVRDRWDLLFEDSALSDWPRLRGLVRRWLLTGDVQLRQDAQDTPVGHYNGGLDTQARCELMGVLWALRIVQGKDRRTYQLLRRDIGRPCQQRRHDIPQGHCHRIPLAEMPLLTEMSWEEAERETEKAVEWLLSVTS